jgi:hypothetical protein
MKRIRLYGGFHNSPEIIINVSDNAAEDWKNEKSNFQEILSEYQRKRLENHFCGIKGCTCGSYMRAEKEIL